MQKLLKYIILLGIFILPLINSRITSLLWFSFSVPVNWNFEFTKVMFFNVWSSVVIWLFFISLFFNHQRAIRSLGHCWKVDIRIFLFYIILMLSTYFSVSPYISFFWNEIKAHSFIMWSNLVWLFIVFSSIIQPPLAPLWRGEFDNKFFKKIITTFIISWVFVSLIWLKEYFLPTFDYWDLWNRLFSTFGHPNYVSIFLVALMPFLYNPIFNLSPEWESIAQSFIIIIFWITLLFTKSIFAIFLFIWFNVYHFYSNLKRQRAEAICWQAKKQNTSPFFKGSTRRGRDSFIKYSVVIVLFLTLSFFLLNLFPEKLHSFISRYFIWETTLKVIFSDINIFLLWWWSETFIYYFDNFKWEYLYIFENLWFSADRPHNLVLNFFYHFGVLGLIFILWLYYKIFSISTESKAWDSSLKNATKISLILIFLFLLLNFASIVLYVLIVILLAYLFSEKAKDWEKSYYYLLPLLFTITIVSIFWAYQSAKFYISETRAYNNELIQAWNIYKYNPNNYFFTWNFERWLELSTIEPVEYYYAHIAFSKNIWEKRDICRAFTEKSHYAESYFYCWNSFWDDGFKKEAQRFYKDWLNLLPDLWNTDSQYYKKNLIKGLKVNWNRFLSEKYGLKRVLERGK